MKDSTNKLLREILQFINTAQENQETSGHTGRMHPNSRAATARRIWALQNEYTSKEKPA